MIHEYIPNTHTQQTFPKKVFPDFGLVFPTRNNNAIRPNNTTVHIANDRILTTSTSQQGFIKTSKLRITQSEDPNTNGDITSQAIRSIKAPPMEFGLCSFGKFEDEWRWAILPSPYEQSPFSKTPVEIFTTPFISHEAFPQTPHKPLWKSEGWRIAGSIPNDGVVSFMWKYLNHVVLSKNTLVDYPVCEYCQRPTSSNHIQFKCPASQELWKKFDEEHSLTIPPSQCLLNRCTWRVRGCEKSPPILAQLVFLHLYHVWSAWWSFQKSPDHPNIIHPHSLLRRVITCYLCLNDQTSWNESPHFQKCQSEWKKLHKVQNIPFQTGCS